MNTMWSFLEHGLGHVSLSTIIIVTLVTTHVTIAAVTIFLHRCQAHRALTLHPVVSHFFRFWLWLTTGMDTKEWVAIHRKHHAKVETVDDPHSPVRKGIGKILFAGTEEYRREVRSMRVTMYASFRGPGTELEIDRYSKGTPDDVIERKLYARHTRLGISIFLLIDVLLFGGLGLSVWAIQMAWIPFFAAGVINGVGHYVGYRHAATWDNSRNIVPWGILTGGEELHNNHHAFPGSAKLSLTWYEFDIGWLYIRVLTALGLAEVKKAMPTVVRCTYLRDPDHVLLSELAPIRWLILRVFDRMARKTVRSRVLMEKRSGLEDLWANSRQGVDILGEKLRQWCAEAEQGAVRDVHDTSDGDGELRKFSLWLRSLRVIS